MALSVTIPISTEVIENNPDCKIDGQYEKGRIVIRIDTRYQKHYQRLGVSTQTKLHWDDAYTYCLTGNGISIRNGSRSAGLGPVFGVTLWIAVDRCFFLAEIGARGDITSSDPSPVFFAMRGGHALI